MGKTKRAGDGTWAAAPATKPVGVLYVVGTPLGNLADLSARASETLGKVDFVVAEDTRQAKKLLHYLDVKKPVDSFHAHSPPRKAKEIVERLRQGQSAALVTDAGMPVVSDPGAELVAAAVAHGVAVSVIPGPSAVSAALAVAGFPADRYVFWGFLPRTGKARRAALLDIAEDRRTAVIFEAPHRILRFLDDVAPLLGERPLAVCRELTKMHEEVLRGSAANVAQALRDQFGAAPRGEFTVVVGPVLGDGGGQGGV